MSRNNKAAAIRFYTDYQYLDRETKARYVWLKYRPILKGRLLDVGADECYLKQHLNVETEYWGIGLGGHPDQQVDLEKDGIPFPENSFDCVLCLDVLEHIENIHQIFDELCKVTRRHVIISLPNPWGNFYQMLQTREYRPGQATKFYGLPLERAEDRHKWFFSNEEAEKFILHRADKNQMQVVQIDNEGKAAQESTWLKQVARNILFRRDLNFDDLYAGTLWAVLEKTTASKV